MYIFAGIGKAEFSASLLQTLVSHDPSETIHICWFAPQKLFLLLSMLCNTNCDTLFFRILWWMEMQTAFEIEILVIEMSLISPHCLLQ